MTKVQCHTMPRNNFKGSYICRERERSRTADFLPEAGHSAAAALIFYSPSLSVAALFILLSFLHSRRGERERAEEYRCVRACAAFDASTYLVSTHN
jgi:hypothetical protein